MNLQITEQNEKLINVDLFAGTHIEKACSEMLELANEFNVPVLSTFNGIDLQVSPGELSEEAYTRWQTESERRQNEYKTSDEYKNAQKERSEKLSKKQAQVDLMLCKLAECCETEKKLVEWIGSFAEISDDAGLNYERSALAEKLIKAGYQQNDCVGHPSVKTDKTFFARWLVGQAIDNLLSGMPIHPVATKFASDYTNL